MSTFRISKRENPFVQIDKSMVKDNRMSFKAKGILMYLLSRPDDWQVYESEIMKHSKDGRDSARSGIKELIDNGYIIRKPNRDKEGKYRGYEYIVYETTQNHVGKSDNGISYIGKPPTTNKEGTNKDLTNKDKRYTVSLGNSECVFLNYYNEEFKRYKGKEHPLMTGDKYEYVESKLNELRNDNSIDDDEMYEFIDRHFAEMSDNNDGKIYAFIDGKGADGVMGKMVRGM